jgi:vacuolar-type H+-ATPase subunit E/Vma4
MPNISIEMIGVIVLSVMLAGVLIAYDRVLRKLQRQHHEENKLHEEAQRRAEKVLQEARDKAKEIISQAQLNGEELQKQLAQMIDEVDKDHIGEYKEKLHKISQDIESNLQDHFTEFRKVLESQTVGAQQAAATKVESQYQQIQKELVEYRQKRLAEIEQGLMEALETGLKGVVGEMISIEGKRELITKGLEEAKKQNVFERG